MTAAPLTYARLQTELRRLHSEAAALDPALLTPAAVCVLSTRERDLRKSGRRRYAVGDRGFVYVSPSLEVGADRLAVDVALVLRGGPGEPPAFVWVDAGERGLTRVEADRLNALTDGEREATVATLELVDRWVAGSLDELPPGVSVEESWAPWATARAAGASS